MTAIEWVGIGLFIGLFVFNFVGCIVVSDAEDYKKYCLLARYEDKDEPAENDENVLEEEKTVQDSFDKDRKSVEE